MAVRVKLSRAQIRKVENIPLTMARSLDVTVGSAEGWAQAFAPTWDMVMGHKRGTVSDLEYIARYEEILGRIPDPLVDKSEDNPWRLLYAMGARNGGKLTVLCYCRDGVFCHTHILMKYAADHWPKAFEQ